MSDDSKLYALFKTYSSGGIPEKEKLCVELTHQTDYKNYYPLAGLRIDLPDINPDACVKSIGFDLRNKKNFSVSYDLGDVVRNTVLTPHNKEEVNILHEELGKSYVRKRITMDFGFYRSGNNVIKWSLMKPYDKGLLVINLDELLLGDLISTHNVPSLLSTYFPTLIKYKVLSFDPSKSIIGENELSGNTLLLKGKGVNEGRFIDFVLNHKEEDYLEELFSELRKKSHHINMFGLAPKNVVERHNESLRAWEEFYKKFYKKEFSFNFLV